MTAADILQEIPNRVESSAIAGMNVVVQFDLSGDGGGQYYLHIADGTCSVEEGKSDNPKATILMEASDFVAMSTGQLNAMSAFMAGKIKVQGDLSTVMQMQSILGL